MKAGQRVEVCSYVKDADDFLLIVWADENMKDVIKNTGGVVGVYNVSFPTEFKVYVDKRFNLDLVRENIELRIMLESCKNILHKITEKR